MILTAAGDDHGVFFFVPFALFVRNFFLSYFEPIWFRPSHG